MDQKDKPAPGNNEAEQSKEKDPFWRRPPLVVPIVGAILTCTATVVGALLNADAIWNFILNRPTPTPTTISIEVSPTATNSPFIPTSTPELSCILNHNCPVGGDWGNNCIAGYNWTVYSSSDFPELPKDDRECFSQPILDAFYTKDGGLYIFSQPKALTKSKDYGVFYPLPQSGNVSVDIDLDKVDNAQIWFGIFELPDVSSKGVLLVAPPGDVREQAFALKTMPENKRIEVSRVFQNPSGRYTLGFELEFGSIIANAEGISMTPIPFTSPNRWLFIGYRAKLDDPANGSADIQALFTDLNIK